MKISHLLRFLPVLAALVPVMLTGCRSTAYYQDRAVQRAREYLIENAPELTPSQVAYVRFNKPTLLTENIYGKGTAGWKGSSARFQVCISWLIPDQENIYMVFGVSSPQMSDWYPNRLIRKVFPQKNTNRDSAVLLARTYALNNLYFDLSVPEYNHLRFSDPEILRTKFKLDLNPTGKLTPDQVAANEKMPQFSLVWRTPGYPRPVVICGLAKDHLAGFTISFGGCLDENELKANTVEVVKAAKSPEEIAAEAETAKPDEMKFTLPAENK